MGLVALVLDQYRLLAREAPWTLWVLVSIFSLAGGLWAVGALFGI